MGMEKIIILDEDSALRENLAGQLRTLGCEVDTAAGVDAAQERLHRKRYDLVMAEAVTGVLTETLDQLRSAPGYPPVVLLADGDGASAAIRCLGDGASDVVLKPVLPGHAEAVLRKAAERQRLLKINQRQLGGGTSAGPEALQGTSSALQHLLQLVRKVARTEAPVLIHGEPGTGKREVARELYRQSSRSRSTFLAFDCAGWPQNQVEVELFGEAITMADGSVVRREGVLETANGGTLVLLEIGELPPEAQERLLRFLQTQTLERVGGEVSVASNVRLLATTNRNLEAKVQRKEFSEELLFRLNIVPLFVPSLKDRKEDIPILAETFRQQIARRLGREVLAISAAGLRSILDYGWPGNLRELEHTVERAVLRCANGGVLEANHFGLPVPEGTATDPEAAPVENLHDLEKKHIFVVLERCHGNRTHAARKLGISIRTLRNKLREYRETGEVICAPPGYGK